MKKNNFEKSTIYSEIQKVFFSPEENTFDDPYWVKTKSDKKLACYYFQKYPDAMTIVHFHGNGETVKDYLDAYIQIIDSLKFNIFFAEYRGYGMSKGKPSLSGILNDIEPIFESINVPLEKIVVYGKSFGSLSAIHAVSLYPKIRGLILESGIASFSEFQPLVDYLYYKPINSEDDHSEKILEEIEKYFNIKAKLSLFRGSTLIFHCKNDDLIPVINAKKLIKWANEAKLKIFLKGNHNSLVCENLNAYCDQLFSFVNSLY